MRSVLGRFLEHSRVYYFCNDDKHDLSCASADWMDRNFFRRVEVCFPIENVAIKARMMEELSLYLRDEAGTWRLAPDGQYHRAQADSSLGESVQRILLERHTQHGNA